MSRFIIIPHWSSTVGHLFERGAAVSAFCSSCAIHRPVNLELLIKSRGELYSLWNRHARCKTRGCRTRVFFIASLPGDSTWPTNMRTDDVRLTAHLHEIWRADRDAKRREGLELSWLLKLRRQRAEVRARASELLDRYGPKAAEVAEKDMEAAAAFEHRLAIAAEVRREILRRFKAKPLDEDELSITSVLLENLSETRSLVRPDS